MVESCSRVWYVGADGRHACRRSDFKLRDRHAACARVFRSMIPRGLVRVFGYMLSVMAEPTHAAREHTHTL